LGSTDSSVACSGVPLRSTVIELARRYPGFHDEARPKLVKAPPIPFPQLRPYQAAAVASWEFAGNRGIIALPTGSGKTRTAIAVISKTRLRTLCLVPTRALTAQWIKILREISLLDPSANMVTDIESNNLSPLPLLPAHCVTWRH
jgi:superfamily II DNA or RNA helicase